MLVREKIKLLRLSKNWTQEYLAEKLGMSSNGYGEIERGKTRMTVDKLEELARIFDIPFNELYEDEKTNVFIAHNIGHSSQQNNQSDCTICSHVGNLELKHELEKQQLLNTEQSKEIALLKEIIELLKAKNGELA